MRRGGAERAGGFVAAGSAVCPARREGTRRRAWGPPRQRGGGGGLRIALEAPVAAAGFSPPGCPRGARDRGCPGGGRGAERGRRAPAPASPPRGSAFRMKSRLSAGGFIGAEHIRDVSSAKCRSKAPCSAMKPADTRSRRKSSTLFGTGRPWWGTQPSAPSCPTGTCQIWKKIKYELHVCSCGEANAKSSCGKSVPWLTLGSVQARGFLQH